MHTASELLKTTSTIAMIMFAIIGVFFATMEEPVARGNIVALVDGK